MEKLKFSNLFILIGKLLIYVNDNSHLTLTDAFHWSN